MTMRKRPGAGTPPEHTPLEQMALNRDPIPADMVPIVSQSLGRYYCLPPGWVLACPIESRIT